MDQNAPIDPTAVPFGVPDTINLLHQEFEKIRHDSLEISIADIQFKEKLGEGAFGIVHRGIVRTKYDKKQEVAIKSLKGNELV